MEYCDGPAQVSEGKGAPSMQSSSSYTVSDWRRISKSWDLRGYQTDPRTGEPVELASVTLTIPRNLSAQPADEGSIDSN